MFKKKMLRSIIKVFIVYQHFIGVSYSLSCSQLPPQVPSPVYVKEFYEDFMFVIEVYTFAITTLIQQLSEYIINILFVIDVELKKFRMDKYDYWWLNESESIMYNGWCDTLNMCPVDGRNDTTPYYEMLFKPCMIIPIDYEDVLVLCFMIFIISGVLFHFLKDLINGRTQTVNIQNFQTNTRRKRRC